MIGILWTTSIYKTTKDNKFKWTDHSGKNTSLLLIKSSLASVVLKQQQTLLLMHENNKSWIQDKTTETKTLYIDIL